jgi:hypothetical protein
MASKVAAAALQYSKKLSQEITWFWIFYRPLVLILSAIQPSIAPAMSQTIAGVDTIMMLNVGTYLINSVGEKYIYSDRFVLSWLKGNGWKNLIGKVNSVEIADESESNG